MEARIGTSGYAYKAWKGHFYPKDLAQAAMLRYYAGRLNTVEINNTFYRMPSEKVLVGWAEQVPEDFSFVLKASRRITHQKQLRDAQDELSYLLRTASVLGPRLGPMLFQTPPFLRKDLDVLSAFLDLLPPRWKAAFEFRHASWFDDEVFDVLRSRQAALVAADTDAEPDPSVEATASFGYVRMRRDEYDTAALRSWCERLRGQPWETVYVFFKHEDAGVGPKLAAEFTELFSALPAA